MNDFTCTDLIAREFWVDGKLLEELVCFFLVFSNGDILKASYNDEVHIWELVGTNESIDLKHTDICLLYTSPSPRDQRGSRMPSSA